MTDDELKELVRTVLEPFLFEPATEEMRETVEAALHAAGVPLAPADAVRFEPNGNVVMRLADGRELTLSGQELTSEMLDYNQLLETDEA